LLSDPGFDYGRFDVPYWLKFARALRLARDHDVIFSLVLDMTAAFLLRREVRTSIGSSAMPLRVSAPFRVSSGTSATISIGTATTAGHTTPGP
jgi:hypothetical protein